MKNSHHLLAAVVGPCLLFAGTLLGAVAHGASITAVTETSAYTFLTGERVAGPATEVVEKTLQTAGLTDYQLKLYPWARAYDMALKEPGVLIYLIARTPVREQQFQWAGEIMTIQYHLYRLRERTDIHVKTLADAKNYTIGVMRDDVRQQYLQTKGFYRLTVSAQAIDSFNKLIKHQVDLLPLAEADTSGLCLQAHFDCAGLERVLTLDETTVGLYMAYSTSTEASIVQRTRVAFDKLKADGTVRRIMEKKP
jgi:polar amino acid transport system substrate-binding protein